MCYLYSNGSLLGHGLIHPNEGHVVVQIVHRALKENKNGRVKGQDREFGLELKIKAMIRDLE